MKKVAYILAHNINKNDGVAKKVASQVGEWRKLGKEVEVFCIVPKAEKSLLEARQYMSPGILRQRLLRMTDLYDDVMEFNPDVIYYRFGIWNSTIVQLSKRFKVIAEINTDDIAEYWLILKEKRSLKALARLLTVLTSRGRFLRRMAGIATVTKELSEMRRFTKYCTNTGVFPNSINLDEYHTIKSLAFQSERLSFFFIGSPGQSWHGLDIIERMAERLSDCDFHIVGIDRKGAKNIYYHGYLGRDEYTAILEKCHICIGSLALYRAGLKEACPLKVREYLAYGYPVMIGYDDTSFLSLKTPSWLQCVEGEEQFDAIRQFAAANKNTIVQHSELGSISSAVIEKRRLTFMESCVKPSSSS